MFGLGDYLYRRANLMSSKRRMMVMTSARSRSTTTSASRKRNRSTRDDMDPIPINIPPSPSPLMFGGQPLQNPPEDKPGGQPLQNQEDLIHKADDKLTDQLPKRGRGRPRKKPKVKTPKQKRGRGRPSKLSNLLESLQSDVKELVDLKDQLKRSVEDFPSFMSSSAPMVTLGKLMNEVLDYSKQAKERSIKAQNAYKDLIDRANVSIRTEKKKKKKNVAQDKASAWR